MSFAVTKSRVVSNNIEKGQKEDGRDSMQVLFIMSWFLIFISFLIYKTEKRKNKEVMKWGMGVDCCFFYSHPFKVEKNSITLIGSQEILDGKSAIKYSIVKRNWWGKRLIFAQEFIFGNYKESNSFHLTVSNIPNGGNYQIEVFNSFIMSYGCFKIVT